MSIVSPTPNPFPRGGGENTSPSPLMGEGRGRGAVPPALNRRAFLGLGVVATLSGCGFQPVYMPTASGKPGVAQRELAAVFVNVIGDRPGQLLRQALQERLERGATGVEQLYTLSVSYGIGGEGIAIQSDNTSTYTRLVARASWYLNAQDPAKTSLAHGAARAADNFNVIDEQYFAADQENDFAAVRLADAVADQITLQLAAYFRHRELPPAATG
jgi:LPS-assembly lipoprotein